MTQEMYNYPFLGSFHVVVKEPHPIDSTLMKSKRVIYLSPYKSLTEEKYEDWIKRYKDKKISIMTGDYTLSPEAISNLLINAKESMLDGGNIEISAVNENLNEDSIPLQSGKYVKITIKDFGIGIPQENLDRIYDPFFSTKPREDQQGVGLGLTITHSIIKRHNGHLNITSKVGVGTTIEIYLPASDNQSTN